MTLNKDLFEKDPTTFVIPNDGVSKIDSLVDQKQWEVLRYELESFVVDGEYRTGLERVLDSYLRNVGRPTQPAVWVSGFYGSGKSHLVRVLQHLWADTRFPDGVSARSLVTGLPASITDALRELDVQAARIGAPAWSVAGGLDAAGSQHLNQAFLEIVLSAAGLPRKLAPAQVVLWLREHGLEEPVSTRLASDGLTLLDEVRDFTMSEPLAAAVLAERPGLAENPPALLAQLTARFGETDGLSTTDVVEVVREVLAGVGSGVVPPTLIVLDEVQQYVSEDTRRALDIQGLVQALSSQFEGRLLVVATGQQEMAANPELAKIQDRFSVKTHLRNQDVDEVVRRVLLQKKASAAQSLSSTLDQLSGEIGRELAGARIGHRSEDDTVLVRDYPLLPARRRFWEAVLREADQGGRAGQLRSQLRIVHEANQEVADEPVGTVVGADLLYNQKASDMNSAGKLLKDVQLAIADEAKKTGDGPLRARILGTLHLISLLPTEGAADTGVRPTASHVADLLIRDLDLDGARLRERVPALLDDMARDGVVQQHGAEYRIQTVEGREWDGDYRGKRAALVGDAGQVAAFRDELLRAAVTVQVPPSIRQGSSKVARSLRLQFGQAEPLIEDAVPVWVRSEWDGLTPRQFADLTRGTSQEDPLVFVYLPSVAKDELKESLLDLQAAQQVLDTRALPTTDEGQQARRAMESQRDAARRRVDALVADVLAHARVELAGGLAGEGATLRARLEQAAARAAARLYPEFDLADDARWDVVVKRVSQGDELALEAVGYTGSPELHPAAAKVFAQVGGGWTGGSALRDAFTGRPYGWSQDAVRGLLGALVAGGFVAAHVNGSPADAKQVMALGTRLGQLQVRRESVTLAKPEQLKLRGLLKRLGQTVAGDDPLGPAARRAIDTLVDRAQHVSGVAPLPEVTIPAALADLSALSGNELASRFLAVGDEAEGFASRVSVLEGRRNERTGRLSSARGLAEAARDLDAARDAISRLRELESTRELLADDDHVTPVQQELASVLRAAVMEAADSYDVARHRAVATLDVDPSWQGLDEHVRERLLAQKSLGPQEPPLLSDATALGIELNRRPLAGWSAMRDALPSRLAQVLEEAVRLTKPESVAVGVPGRTLSSDAELDAYLAEVREKLAAQLRAHGTIVVRGS